MKLFRKAQQVNEYYKSSSLCPLWNFNQVLSLGNLKALTISGNPSDEELQEAWESIYSEFSEIIKDKSADLYFLSIKHKAAKKHKIAYLSVLLQYYVNNPDEAEKLLIDEGFRVTDNIADTYRMAFGKVKRMNDDILHEEKSEEKREAVDFDSIISELEKYQGYQFDQKSMTVKHFANIYKRFKENGRKN